MTKLVYGIDDNIVTIFIPEIIKERFLERYINMELLEHFRPICFELDGEIALINMIAHIEEDIYAIIEYKEKKFIAMYDIKNGDNTYGTEGTMYHIADYIELNDSQYSVLKLSFDDMTQELLKTMYENVIEANANEE